MPRITDLPTINAAGQSNPALVLVGVDNGETAQSEKATPADLKTLMGLDSQWSDTLPAIGSAANGDYAGVWSLGVFEAVEVSPGVRTWEQLPWSAPHIPASSVDFRSQTFTLGAAHATPLTLAVPPTDPESMDVFHSGLNITLAAGDGYTLAGSDITLGASISATTNAGDELIVRYY